MKGKVLIIDDEPISGKLINFQLSEAGFESVYYDNAIDALRQIDRVKPDIIISDIVMPEMDGYELHQELRKNPITANIPFIFLTAKTSKSDELTGLSLGVDDYIGKPPMIEILVKRIEKALGRAEKARKRNNQALFSGRLGQAGLHSFIQIITSAARSGELVFYNLQGKTIGSIFFGSGVLLNAGKDSLDGEDALYELAAETEGYVEFYEKPVEDAPRISISSTTALITVEQMLEKRNYLMANLPHQDVSLTARDKNQLRKHLEEKEPGYSEKLYGLIDMHYTVRDIIATPTLSQLRAGSILSDLLRRDLVMVSDQTCRVDPWNMDMRFSVIERSLLEALKQHESQMSTGVLEIKDLPQEASVYFKNGRIVHTSYGNAINRKALFRIFGETGGRPIFQDLSEISKNGMKWPLDSLLQDGVKEIHGLQKVQAVNYRYLLTINNQALKQLPLDQINPGMKHILPLVYQHGKIQNILEASDMTDYQTIKYLHYMAKKGVLQASLPNGEQQ